MDNLDWHLQEKISCSISFVNPHVLSELSDHENYLLELKKLTYLCADGIGLVMLNKLLCANYRKAAFSRLSFDFTSLAEPVLTLSIRKKAGVFFYGSKPGVAKAAAEKMKMLYPQLEISGIEDGYTNTHEVVSHKILASGAQIVIIGLGSYRQEVFANYMREQAFSGICITCGGFLDQTAIEGKHYYPYLVNKLNLRFVFRILREPRRLIKRYTFGYVPFYKAVFFALLSRLTIQ